ncbi:MAG: DnaJ domain-containing protein [Candidatus Aminicenantaceae bacterium]
MRNMNHIAYHLKHIHHNKKSGLLNFTQEDIKKIFLFQDGDLIYAKTNQPEERLAAVLFKLGKISQETYSKIDFYIKYKQKVGEVLVKEGYISKTDLYEGLISQMREITLNTFPFFDGEFFFEVKESLIDQKLEAEIDIPLLIEDGIKRMKYHPSLKSFGETKVFFRKSDEYSYLLQAEDKEILNSVDGISSATEILNSAGYNAELFWKSLYLFYCLDLVDVKIERKDEIIKEEEEGKITLVKEKKQLADVDDMVKRFPSLNYYQILDVSRSASDREIKKAYFSLARKFHPDSFDRNLPHEARKNIEDVFTQISNAYQTLIDKEKRKEYDSQIELPSEEEEQDPSKKADTRFRQAKTLYNQKRYEDALVLLEEAVRLVRNKGYFFLLLALTESKILTMQKKAEEDFLKAIDLEPWNPECYVGLGLLYKQAGLRAKAKKQFKKALELDPDHSIALREVEMASKEERKRGLKDLFSFELFGQKKKRK